MQSTDELPDNSVWQLQAVRAFSDNYIWMLHRAGQAIVVDPGDCDPVFAALEQTSTTLAAILITHHHPDHIGGVDALMRETACTVYGPSRERMPRGCIPLSGDQNINTLGIDWRVIDLPGHTLGHIGYVANATPVFAASDLATAGPKPSRAPLLLCGDTLFSAGCGRLFEGTPEQMHASLQSLAALDDDTWVLCTHEYTLANLRFAQAVCARAASSGMDNWRDELRAYTQLCAERRERGALTLPSTIGMERRVNPYLRCASASVRSGVGLPANSADVEVFAALRRWKDEFR